jgi:hypothetical protein
LFWSLQTNFWSNLGKLLILTREKGFDKAKKRLPRAVVGTIILDDREIRPVTYQLQSDACRLNFSFLPAKLGHAKSPVTDRAAIKNQKKARFAKI